MARPASLPSAVLALSLPLLGLVGAVVGPACATSDPVEPAGEGGGPSGDGGAGPGGGLGGDPGSTTTAETTAETTGVTTSSTASSSSVTTGATTGVTTAASSSTGGGCGDGAIDGVEACDGADLGAATCQTEGFDAGTLACDASCALDTSGCMNVVACENGVDDDADGLTDAADPACTGAGDDDELVFSTSCNGFGGDVIDLSTAPGVPIVQTGTTVGAPAALTSTLTASCPTTGGPEVAFRLVVTQTSDLLLSLDHAGTSAGWDPVLYVRSGSCTGAQVGCNDDAGGTLKSELVLAGLAAGTYYVFVDSAGSSGDFELTVDTL